MSSYNYTHPTYCVPQAEYNMTNYNIQPRTSYTPKAAMIMFGVGAVIGGASAAAKNIRQIKNHEIDRKDAIANITNEMVGTGLATGLSSAVMSSFNTGMVLSLLGTAVLATGTKYLWDGMSFSCDTSLVNEKE